MKIESGEENLRNAQCFFFQGDLTRELEPGATTGPPICPNTCLETGILTIGFPLKKPNTSGLYLYLYQTLGFEAAEAGHKWGVLLYLVNFPPNLATVDHE